MKHGIDRAVAVVVLAVAFAWSIQTARQTSARPSGAARQGWEYRTVVTARTDIREDYSIWFEDGKELPKRVDMNVKRKELGEQGWELVSVVAIADTPWGCNDQAQLLLQTTQGAGSLSRLNRTMPFPLNTVLSRYGHVLQLRRQRHAEIVATRRTGSANSRK